MALVEGELRRVSFGVRKQQALLKRYENFLTNGGLPLEFIRNADIKHANREAGKVDGRIAELGMILGLLGLGSAVERIRERSVFGIGGDL